MLNQNKHTQDRSDTPLQHISTNSLRKPMALLALASLVALASTQTLASDYPYQNSHWYFGGNVGQSHLRIKTTALSEQALTQNAQLSNWRRDNSDVGYKLYSGIALNDYLALEGGIFYLGKVSVSGDSLWNNRVQPFYASIRNQGVNLGLAGRLPFNDLFALTARWGLTYNDTNSRQSDFSGQTGMQRHTQHYVKHNYGAGFSYALSPVAELTLDFDNYALKDNWGDQHDFRLVSLGFVYHYGQSALYAEPSAAPEPQQNLQPADVIAPAPPVAPAPAPAAQIIELADIHFEFNQSRLTEAAKNILAGHIRVLQSNPTANVLIIGYTSASGTESYNQKLSEQRAMAVKTYLINTGQLAAGRLTTKGYGETSLAMPEVNPQDIHSVAAKANMRVIFSVEVNRR